MGPHRRLDRQDRPPPLLREPRLKHVRTLDLADYPSGALIQRPATDWRGRKTTPALTEKPQTLPTRQPRFEPFERALWPVLNEAVI